MTDGRSAEGIEDFHDLVAERYEQGATIVTSNLDFSEWGDAFPNRLLGAATLDRLRHGAYRLTLEGESYRSPRPMPVPRKSTVATSSEALRTSGRPIDSTSRARERCRRRSSVRSTPRASRMPSGTPSRSEVTRTPSRRLRVRWGRLCTDCARGLSKPQGSVTCTMPRTSRERSTRSTSGLGCAEHPGR